MLMAAKRTAAAGFVGGILGFVLKDIYEKEWSSQHDIISGLNQYLIFRGMQILSSYCKKKFEDDCSNGPKVNEDLLLYLLKLNQNTEYGQSHHFSEINDRETFRSAHALTRHGHYASYLKRMAEGEQNVLVHDELKMFARTSGTSGSRVLLPVTPLQRKIFFMNGLTIVFHEMFKAFPRCLSLQKSLKLMYVPSYNHTATGLRIGPNSSSPGDSKSTMYLYTTPEVAYCTGNEQEMLFLHALFALADERLGHIEANFIFHVFNLMTFIHEHWHALATCIELGKLDRTQLNSIDEEKLVAIENTLRADPRRAQLIRRVCQESFVNDGYQNMNTMKALWPSINMVLSNETGSFQLYGQRLREMYMGPRSEDHVPIYSPIYAASEGLIGVNVDVHGKYYVLVPRAMFFEFIPIEESEKENPATFFVDEVEIGKVYELVITNLCGLYRYRLGDVVKVVGKHGAMPKIEFMYRQGQILNIRGEKSSEKMLNDAVKAMSMQWKNFRLVDFTSVEQGNQKGSVKKARYEIYIEVEDAQGHHSKAANKSIRRKFNQTEQSKMFDASLQKENDIYELFRKKKRLHAPEIKVLKPGTFEKIRRQLVDSGTSVSQVKIPRVARHPDVIKILHENCVE